MHRIKYQLKIKHDYKPDYSINLVKLCVRERQRDRDRKKVLFVCFLDFFVGNSLNYALVSVSPSFHYLNTNYRLHNFRLFLATLNAIYSWKLEPFLVPFFFQKKIILNFPGRIPFNNHQGSLLIVIYLELMVSYGLQWFYFSTMQLHSPFLTEPQFYFGELSFPVCEQLG